MFPSIDSGIPLVPLRMSAAKRGVRHSSIRMLQLATATIPRTRIQRSYPATVNSPGWGTAATSALGSRLRTASEIPRQLSTRSCPCPQRRSRLWITACAREVDSYTLAAERYARENAAVAVAEAGFQAIAPDLRGHGDLAAPEDPAASVWRHPRHGSGGPGGASGPDRV